MKNTFGEFLKQKRQEKNLTQKELSKILIVSESAISKWEKDVAHPDITLLPKLAEVLSVTEHELITASIDKSARKDKVDAKKWRTFSFTWSLFFYISYIVALIPCFICDLAINGKLTWFYIVLSSLMLAFTFTNLPKLIKKHKLILLPLFQYLALCLLLAVCCIYSKGNWFIIPTLSILLGLTIIFLPIYVCKYKAFEKIKKYGDFFSIAVIFAMILVLLLVIDGWTLSNKYAPISWFLTALPIVLSVYAIINLCLMVRLLKVNKFLKTSIILSISAFFGFLVPPLIKLKNAYIQSELDDVNIFKANLKVWQVNATLEANICLITFLSLVGLILIFATIGLILQRNKKTRS